MAVAISVAHRRKINMLSRRAPETEYTLTLSLDSPLGINQPNILGSGEDALSFYAGNCTGDFRSAAYWEGLYAGPERAKFKTRHISVVAKDAQGLDLNPWESTVSMELPTCASRAEHHGSMSGMKNLAWPGGGVQWNESLLSVYAPIDKPVKIHPLLRPDLAAQPESRSTSHPIYIQGGVPTSCQGFEQEFAPRSVEQDSLPIVSEGTGFDVHVIGVPPSDKQALHRARLCRPCHYFFSKVGCNKGDACDHCHYKHKKRRRGRCLGSD